MMRDPTGCEGGGSNVAIPSQNAPCGTRQYLPGCLVPIPFGPITLVMATATLLAFAPQQPMKPWGLALDGSVADLNVNSIAANGQIPLTPQGTLTVAGVAQAFGTLVAGALFSIASFGQTVNVNPFPKGAPVIGTTNPLNITFESAGGGVLQGVLYCVAK